MTKKIEAAIVRHVEPGGTFTDEGYGLIGITVAQGPVQLAFTKAQLAQLVPQLAGLLGKLSGDSSVVLRASKIDIGRTLDDSLRINFTLLDGATLCLSVPMDCASQASDRIREEAEKAPDQPPPSARH